MTNKFINKPIEALFVLLLNKNKILNETDLRIGGFLLLLLANQYPKESIDVYLYDIADQIYFYPSQKEHYLLKNNLELDEQKIFKSLQRLSQQEVLDVAHIGGELYQVSAY